MSWLDRITSGLTITTGDGQIYSPNWLNAQKSVEYNVSEFNFPDIEGTMVYRGTAQGRRFPMEIYFQGENHLDVALAFEESAKDNRAWVVSHPFYDDILVHPTSLTFDNTKYNVSKITGTLLETISDIYPKSADDAKDKILADAVSTDDALAEDFVTNIPEPSSADVNTMAATNTEIYNSSKKAVTDTTVAEDLRSAFSTANSAILNATSEPLQAIRTAQAVLSYPYQFELSVSNRLGVLTGSFNRLRESLTNLVRRNDKFMYEANAATVINAMAQTAATPQDGDYDNRNSVLDVIETLIDTYNQYLIDLDGLQTDNNGSENSFTASFTGAFRLSKLINFTVANLFVIAIGAHQERRIILTEDSNAILLTHRFYGLDEFDANLDRFIQTNNLSMMELLGIEQGRTVIYYV